MNSVLLPPGFRFHPTDEELVGYYLKRKVDGLEMELEIIPVIDLYKLDPWELPDKSFLPRRDMEWFFFCLRDRKYPNGSRTNRATVSGYWKATGKDRKVECESSVFGLRKTLVFYIGRAPGGERTDWIMHEYRLCQDLFQGSSNFLGAFALCRVVKRNANWLRGSDPVGDQSKAKKCASSSSSSNSPGCKRGFDGVFNGSAEDESLSLELLDSSNGSSAINSPEAAMGVELLRPPTTLMASSECDRSLEINYSLQEAFEIDSMGMFSNTWEDNIITFQSFQFDSTKDIDGIQTFSNAVMPFPPPICRQASEVEEVDLWFQEDHTSNIVPVM